MSNYIINLNNIIVQYEKKKYMQLQEVILFVDTVWSILYKCLAISEKIKTERENIRYMKRRLTLH